MPRLKAYMENKMDNNILKKRAIALLQDLEWSVLIYNYCNSRLCCPVCFGIKPEHRNGCKLKEAIKNGMRINMKLKGTS